MQRIIFRTLRLAGLMLIAGLLLGVTQAQSRESIRLSLRLDAYEIQTLEGGQVRLTAPDFQQAGDPGAPRLPARRVQIALPPDIAPESLEIDVLSAKRQELAGTYQVAAAPPIITWHDDQRIEEWGAAAGRIVNGRDSQIYGQDAFYPAANVQLDGSAQMRKWRFAELSFTPVRYNPGQGALEVTSEVEVQISFVREVARRPSNAELRDRVMDRAAGRLFENYDQAERDWYAPEAQGNSLQAGFGETSYVIITSDTVLNGSDQLDNFIVHKQARGFSVVVVTEADFGGLTGQAPNGRTEKIRQWLIENYVPLNIEYVLFVGDPTPENPAYTLGDVPMKMCWPRFNETYDRQAPTDYFYADLSGNWDLDGDGNFCEGFDDAGVGGIDLAPEVYVGRIPVYYSDADWVAQLDSILQKTIDYENDPNTFWRQSALLAMSFSDAITDGAYLAEYMQDDYLEWLSFDSYTMYQQGPSCSDSIFPSDETLVSYGLATHWQNNPYGLVAWWAHGSVASASVGYGGCSGGTLINSPQAGILNDGQPAFVFQASCSNAYPEESGNLSYALLKQGAIGSIASSRVSWYYGGEWDPYEYDPTNPHIAYYVSVDLADNQPAGKALYDNKATMPASGPFWYMNLMDYNLYGDPSIKLFESPPGLCQVQDEIPEAECEALVSFYGSTGGGDWRIKDGWLQTPTPCSWFGVACYDGHVTELVQFDNLLSGTLPASLADLTYLSQLVVSISNVSGPIPPELGQLQYLEGLALSRNQLSGEIPASLGNLQSLGALRLDTNHLSGPIPAALGDLSQLGILYLQFNALSGSIPAELGDLSQLRLVDLRNNALEGEVPANLTGLAPDEGGSLSSFDIDYNALNASDPAVIAFLDEFDGYEPNWAETQTVPPTGLAAETLSSSSIRLTWTPILYTGDGGSYEIGIATAPGGPYTVAGQTADKTASEWVLEGLTPEIPYYAAVRSFTPAHGDYPYDQQNDLLSAWSSELAFTIPSNVLDVAIDVKPGVPGNLLNLETEGLFPVAILTTPDFNAPARVDPASLTFGYRGDEASLHYTAGGLPACSAKDVNGDRRRDLSCQFNILKTGFWPGDVQGTLKGLTVDALPIQGQDMVDIRPLQALPVAIDVKPGAAGNILNLDEGGLFAVAILTTPEFDAPARVDPTYLTFGPTGHEASLHFNDNGVPACSAKDVNEDGLLDLSCQFELDLTGFQPADTLGILHGRTQDLLILEGSDMVDIRPDP